ncbi:MAG TPA: TlpA disulfide reductase family protein [Gemmatimonadales bacterium]|jgi:thiol-disulfide isomerase/thioredoxin|nr:TlpA disulfide reductase family protein [Gemmatimonadales bacterium]
MLRRTVTGLAIGTLLAAAPAMLTAQTDQVGMPVGTVAKPVTIQNLNGEPVDLSQYIGKRPVLLEFWATWCPLCKALEPKLEQAHARFGAQVQFLAVSVGVNESPRSIKRHLQHDSLPYPVLWDGNGKATRAFMAPTTSYIVILDGTGKVVYTGVGEDQDVTPILAKLTKTAG